MADPKPADQRQRRNKTSTNTTLVRNHNVTAPTLPNKGTPWLEVTLHFWNDLWSSPMAPEFESDADKHGLFLLAQLWEDFWRTPENKPRQRADIAAEIRQQSQRYGLSPYDRRRLQWTVESAESAMERGRQRRARTIETVDPGDDPRAALYAAQ